MQKLAQNISGTWDASAPPRASAAATRHRVLTLAAMSLGFGVVQLDVTIVNTALHAIGSSLGDGVTGVHLPGE